MREAQGECVVCAWKEGRGGWGRKICEGQQRGWYQAVSSCAVTRGQSHRMQRPEDDGSAQHVGGHGLVISARLLSVVTSVSMAEAAVPRRSATFSKSLHF